MFVGLTLSLAFVNLASLAATLARLIVAEAAHTRARRVVLIAVTTLAAVALPQTVSAARVFQFSPSLAASFRATWPGRVLLAPFEVFSNAMLAERWFPDLLGWAAAAAAIDLALLVLVLRLDADYLEWSTAISQRAYEQQQAHATDAAGSRSIHRGGASRFRLPQLPWLGGAGPIAWRQLVQSQPHHLGDDAIMMLMFTVVFLIWNWYLLGPIVRAPATALAGTRRSSRTSRSSSAWRSRWPSAGTSIISTSSRRCRCVPWPWPRASWPDAAVILAAVQLAILAIYGVATASGGWLLLATAVLALPVNLILLAISNLVFLIYPVRSDARRRPTST